MKKITIKIEDVHGNVQEYELEGSVHIQGSTVETVPDEKTNYRQFYCSGYTFLVVGKTKQMQEACEKYRADINFDTDKSRVEELKEEIEGLKAELDLERRAHVSTIQHPLTIGNLKETATKTLEAAIAFNAEQRRREPHGY